MLASKPFEFVSITGRPVTIRCSDATDTEFLRHLVAKAVEDNRCDEIAKVALNTITKRPYESC